MYPVTYAWSQFSTGSAYLWNSYVDLHGAAEENARLKKQIKVMQARMVDYAHQKKEVVRLRKLLNFTGRYDFDHFLSEVRSEHTHTPFKSIRIGVPEGKLISAGMPVIGASGAVGRILRVGNSYADVQLLVDINFNLDVVVERTRLRGVIQGTGDQACRLSLHKRADIRIGDRIVTSGAVGGFPEGIPVGRVKRVKYAADRLAPVITVQPWVEYQGLEEVFVLVRMDPSFEAIAEVAGSEWMDQLTRHEQSGSGG
ncbi:MAG: rod shape-determining protein MreC [Zetaproteobacteria bacterium]|nr:rod shape-determining protein MreC [Zetaproteobacteria bacterium]